MLLQCLQQRVHKCRFIKMVLCIILLAVLSIVKGEATNLNGLYSLHQVTPPVGHGECPTWDGRKNILYYVDIHAGDIYSYDYFTKDIRSIHLDGDVAPVVPSKSDSDLLIVGLNRSVAAVKWNGGNDTYDSLEIFTSVADDKPASRMNDGKADKEGRIWFGTMGTGTVDGKSSLNYGTLYKIGRDHIPIPLITPVNISNGIAWNKANDKFYYIDSPSRQIAEYDYDNERGEISNRRPVFDLSEHALDADPDGMTIDKDDNLWIALYGGGSVIKVSPSQGALLTRIPVPAVCVTSVTWGGPDLDVLFVTTSRYSLTERERTQQPGAGSVFALTNLGTAGVPTFEANIIGET